MAELKRHKADDNSPEFNPSLMNETWDLSNSVYFDLLEKQRRLEEQRASERDQQKRARGVWSKIKDILVPV